MRTKIVENNAPFRDRRLVGRVEKLWRELASDRLPSWAEIQSADHHDDWDSCFAIDLALSDGLPYFIYMGEALSGLARVYIAGETRREKTLLDLAAKKMDEAALSREPIVDSRKLKLRDGRRTSFRAVLAPLSDDGVNVTHIFGAVNGNAV